MRLIAEKKFDAAAGWDSLEDDELSADGHYAEVIEIYEKIKGAYESYVCLLFKNVFEDGDFKGRAITYGKLTPAWTRNVLGGGAVGGEAIHPHALTMVRVAANADVKKVSQ